MDPNYNKYLLNDERFQYHREKTKKLAELQENLTDKESLNTLELELEQILNDYKTRFNKTIRKHLPFINIQFQLIKLIHCWK